MPFRSKAQARFMFARHPRIAKRWVKEAKGRGNNHPIRNLPSRKRRKSSSSRRRKRK